MTAPKWWAGLTNAQKVGTVMAGLVVLGFGVGLKADELLETPKRSIENRRIAEQNRALIVAVDSILASHRGIDAHPPEARARAEGDSAIIEALQRGDSLILETVKWTVCVERLDRRQPNIGAAESARICPPPVATND